MSSSLIRTLDVYRHYFCFKCYRFVLIFDSWKKLHNVNFHFVHKRIVRSSQWLMKTIIQCRYFNNCFASRSLWGRAWKSASFDTFLVSNKIPNFIRCQEHICKLRLKVDPAAWGTCGLLSVRKIVSWQNLFCQLDLDTGPNCIFNLKWWVPRRRDFELSKTISYYSRYYSKA